MQQYTTKYPEKEEQNARARRESTLWHLLTHFIAQRNHQTEMMGKKISKINYPLSNPNIKEENSRENSPEITTSSPLKNPNIIPTLRVQTFPGT